MTVVIDRAAYVRSVAASETPQAFAEAMEVDVPSELPSELEWRSLREWAENTAGAHARLDRMEHALRQLAESHLPQSPPRWDRFWRLACVSKPTDVLVWPVSRRAPFRSSGAEKAFFHHLKTGAPSPKHGHIFMHPWISRSPRWVRGKIARMLAGKISIAAKVDAFEGQPWGKEEVAKVEQRVNDLLEANKQPPSRR